MNRIRVGVVGVGYLGKFHAEKYALMNGVELVGVVDIIAERAERVARRFGTKPLTEYTALIGKVDAVSVVVPTHLHFPISRDFLENDVDVLIEKPITKTIDEADALIELARSRGRILQVGHLERFNPAVVAMSDMVEHPLFIESDRLSLFKQRGTEVDVVLDLMIHDIDIILHCVRSELKSIHAVGVPVISPRVDIANARLNFENGCVANMTASRISLKNMRKIRLFQKDTYLSVDCANQTLTVIRKDDHDSNVPIPGMCLQESTFPKADSLECELKAFVQSVRERRAPAVSGREGRNALKVAWQIMDQIRASSKNFPNTL
ncbi:MAG: gfo/Idh/MocA family oxidoreductase [Deltaproteobacteria bacterium]|nr:MAG: gfo/Idh/MocA family oxidoreductase [Deltaproteobacteria bacterium]